MNIINKDNLKERIEAAYNNREYIPCCAVSHKELLDSEGGFSLYVRLPNTKGIDENEWFEVVPIDVEVNGKVGCVKLDLPLEVLKRYPVYSHGLSPKVIKKMYEALGESYV